MSERVVVARVHFEEQKGALMEDLARMGMRVEEDLRRAVEALKSQDKKLADKVCADDSVVNNMQYAIEDTCSIIIATQQPVAQDLRWLISVIMIAGSLERIGDHSVHLAKLVIKLKDEAYLKPIVHIREMAEIGGDQIKDAVKSFVSRDVGLARSVAARDKRVDKLYRSTVKDLAKLIQKNPKHARKATRMLIIASQLERLGDHVVSICESVVYGVEGLRVTLN